MLCYTTLLHVFMSRLLLHVDHASEVIRRLHFALRGRGPSCPSTQFSGDNGVCWINTPFARALAMQFSSRNCYPPPDLVLWQLIFPNYIFSLGVFLSRTSVSQLCPVQTHRPQRFLVLKPSWPRPWFLLPSHCSVHIYIYIYMYDHIHKQHNYFNIQNMCGVYIYIYIYIYAHTIFYAYHVPNTEPPRARAPQGGWTPG